MVITIRNIKESTNAQLTSMAKKKGISKEEFLRRHIETLVLADEIRDAEERYRSLVKVMMKQIEELQEVLIENNFVLNEVKERL